MRNSARQTRLLTLRWMHVLIILGVALTSGAPARPTHAEPPTAPSVAEPASPQPFLNSDGTLKLNGAFSGALDLEGYTVRLDSARGPVFGQATPVGEWAALGEGGGAVNGYVRTLVVSGTEVFVGGDFTDVANIPEADYLAKWDGAQWSALGADGAGDGALSNSVNALAISGTVLYVGGWFTQVHNHSNSAVSGAAYIAQWDTATDIWSALGSNGAGGSSLNSAVNALAISGTVVYVGGNFTDVNNSGSVLTAGDYVARWDALTVSWGALGTNGAGDGSFASGSYISVLAVSGSDLYVGGNFDDINSNGLVLTTADKVAKWDTLSGNWSALGSNGAGNGAISGYVNALAVSGTEVYVGGSFTDVNNGGVVLATADYLARWDTQTSNWSALGNNGANGALNQPVYALFVNGADVYVGGGFTNAAGLATADYIAQWDGANWNALGDNGAGNGAIPNKSDPFIFALAMRSGNLLMGGGFYDVSNGGVALPQADFMAQWNGSAWSALGAEPNGALVNGYAGSYVYAIAVTGTTVYVGGRFTDVSNHGLNLPAADYIAQWDSVTGDWSALGSNGAGNGALTSIVNTIALSGTDVYVGGSFTNVNNNGVVLPTADYIARWNGSSWSALGSNGAGNGALPSGGFVNTLALYGTNVYVGGNFTNVNNGGVVIPEADRIAQWNTLTNTWSALGSDGAGDGALNAQVTDIAVTGAGELYVGGNFTNAATLTAADYVAKWNGAQWSALGGSGSGDGSLNNGVSAIGLAGTDVYVGGYFTDVNNGGAVLTAADLIAKWDSLTGNWSALGNNGAGNSVFCVPCGSSVRAIFVNGADVYVGGSFTNLQSNGATLNAADYVAKWDGAGWSALGSDGAGNGAIKTNYRVYTLVIAGTDLLVGGLFSNVNNNGTVVKEADYIAAYGLGGSAPDITPPTVISVARLDASPAITASVRFLVTFSEAVGGLDASDFFVTASGLTGATLTDMSGCTGAVCTVTVSTGFGEGTLRLDVLDDDSIKDAANNPLGGAGVGNGGFITGETYAVRRFALYLPLIVR